MTAAATVGLPPWTALVATSFRTDSSRHGASPAQVRGKTQPSHRSLSFLKNFKPSRALNHRQSDLQEASVCQPCPPAMEVSRGIILVGPQFLIFWRKIGNYWRWTLFFAFSYYLRSWQSITFGKKILETFGDALCVNKELLQIGMP